MTILAARGPRARVRGLLVVARVGLVALLSLGCSSGSKEKTVAFDAGRSEVPMGPAQYGVARKEGASDVSWAYTRAGEALARNEVGEARRLYTQALAAEPENAQGYVGLGACAMREDKFDEARTDYGHAMALDPKSASARIGMGSVEYRQGRFAESAKLYEDAVVLVETDPDAHFGAALAYAKLKDEPKKRAHAERVIALAPGTPLATRASKL